MGFKWLSKTLNMHAIANYLCFSLFLVIATTSCTTDNVAKSDKKKEVFKTISVWEGYKSNNTIKTIEADSFDFNSFKMYCRKDNVSNKHYANYYYYLFANGTAPTTIDVPQRVTTPKGEESYQSQVEQILKDAGPIAVLWIYYEDNKIAETDLKKFQ